MSANLPRRPTRRRLLLATLAAPSLAFAAGPSTAQWAALFRSLRRERGQFDGAPWRDDVDRWQGLKHRAMQHLGGVVLRKRASELQVRQTLGVPDDKLEPGDPVFQAAVAQPVWMRPDPKAPLAVLDEWPGAELWLYRWRGRHDQLALALVDGRVVATGWLLAGE